MKQKIQHQITPHPLWETIEVEKFHYITNHISKWIEIYSEVAFLFSYAPTLPLYFESIINYCCIGLEQKYTKDAF